MKTTPPFKNGCPKCGAAIPEGSPHGLCAACLLAGAATDTDAGLKPGERITPPPLETVRAAFPDLEVIELIGIGGMSVVYKARQTKLDRMVALKLLPLSHSADPAFAERFHREARFLARLQHPNIVSVYDFGQAGGFYYLLLEFVDGVNLRQAMRAGRFSQAEALGIVPRICEALQYAHDHGVLHRDIKPENILLDARGQVKLADFGIAKVVAGAAGGTGDVTLTQSGSRLGTAHYMAPEQIEKPSDVDHRADIYSLGVVFYELLTGELPLGRFSPPSEKFDIDSRVDAIVFRALSKEREFRQQSAGEVKTEVEGLGAVAGAGGRRETPDPLVAVNPWPNRLGYLILGMVALPVSGILAALIVPVLSRNGLGWSSALAGLLPALTGAALVFGYRQGVKKGGKATPIAEWSPWPRRVFIILAVGVILPVVCLGLGLIVPLLTVKRNIAAHPRSPQDIQVMLGHPQLSLIASGRDGQDVRATWKVESRDPASLRLTHGAEVRDFALRLEPGAEERRQQGHLWAELKGSNLRVRQDGVSYGLEITGVWHTGNPRNVVEVSVKDGTGAPPFTMWQERAQMDVIPFAPTLLETGKTVYLAEAGADSILISLTPGGAETNRTTPGSK